MNYYPGKTSSVIGFESIINHKEKVVLHERMTSRMVKCASVIPRNQFIGWEIRIPQKGKIDMSLFGTDSISVKDLKWMSEHVAVSKIRNINKGYSKGSESDELYEICLPVDIKVANTNIGFGAVIEKSSDNMFRWPVSYPTQFAELMRTLQDSGAVFRAIIGSADEDERNKCRKTLEYSWSHADGNINDYFGFPVRARFLLKIPVSPSVKLKAVLTDAIPGVVIKHLGSMDGELCTNIWNDPLDNASVLPDFAARILALEPIMNETMIGIELSEEKVKPIPVSHKNTKDKGAVAIGRAVSTTGVKQNITIGETDLKRHYQIIGQTGTGKSTLLANIILNAIEQGHGLTFFDPHGTTIDVVLKSVPEKYADKIRVVRIGDADNPVPLNIWDSDDPEKEEKTINDLCELFSDIFDPRKEGFVGPRYERWLSTFCKASIAFLGRRASFESITVISQSQDNMLKVSKAIASKYPELVETIKQEYGLDKSNDFQSTLNWYLCKFQRLTSVEQLRKTLGAGTNALDFNTSIDTDTVTLIDLASPVIGTHASRIVGTMMLLKLWNAITARKKRDMLHMVMVDEAALFQTNPMPRMLAEARKFGISMVLCHQNMDQLNWQVREALESNSANLSAFRLSPRDSAIAAIRFDDPSMQVKLTRLDAFNAITTLSVDGKQTMPFTLKIEKPRVQKDGELIAASIVKNSIEKLVKPYDSLKALTKSEILDYLNHPEKLNPALAENGFKSNIKPIGGDKCIPEWLEAWDKSESERKRKESQRKGEIKRHTALKDYLAS